MALCQFNVPIKHIQINMIFMTYSYNASYSYELTFATSIDS